LLWLPGILNVLLLLFLLLFIIDTGKCSVVQIQIRAYVNRRTHSTDDFVIPTLLNLRRYAHPNIYNFISVHTHTEREREQDVRVNYTLFCVKPWCSLTCYRFHGWFNIGINALFVYAAVYLGDNNIFFVKVEPAEKILLLT